MPQRNEPFVNDQIYHVFNKTIDKRKIFNEEKNCLNFLEISKYYRSEKANISFSKLKTLSNDKLKNILREINYQKYFRVEIYAYCLMPTHFHFLLKQLQEGGIKRYMSNILNSFTKSFNTKFERLGPIYLPLFKSERIKSDEQFIHNSRYIHLNSYSSGIIKNINDLIKYPWSSFKDYVTAKNNSMVNTEPILSYFDLDRDKYKKFVLDNADYQKTLEYLKHIEKW